MGRDKALLALALVVSACSSSTPSDDGGVDAQSDDVAAEAASESGTGCTVQTCNGPVDLKLGQTIQSGDNCGDTCSFKSSGGFSLCGCSYLAGCSCPDAGDQ